MDNSNNILGCFVSSNMGDDSGALFRGYIYGDKGINAILKKLKHEDYGKELILILFQFYVNPIPYLMEGLKGIENYRKKEKSIGIPIIVTNENFFDRSEEERWQFLKESVLHKIDLLTEVVRKKKLDTNMDLLKSDVKGIFEGL